jgi:hypothetical protein
MIKAIAQSMATYIMGVFKLPFSVCDDLTKLVRDFWWGSSDGARKTHLIGWSKLTRSKAQGGMGFRDMRIFNQALLAHQAWYLLKSPESLCARVQEEKYYPQGNLIAAEVSMKSRTSEDSHRNNLSRVRSRLANIPKADRENLI